MLQSNLKGRWERPDGSLVAESMIEFELFTKDLAGVYKFHVTSWSRSEVIAIQIELTAVGKYQYNVQVYETSSIYATYS